MFMEAHKKRGVAEAERWRSEVERRSGRVKISVPDSLQRVKVHEYPQNKHYIPSEHEPMVCCENNDYVTMSN